MKRRFLNWKMRYWCPLWSDTRTLTALRDPGDKLMWARFECRGCGLVMEAGDPRFRFKAPPPPDPLAGSHLFEGCTVGGRPKWLSRAE